ncbi:RNA polymerase sigma-70 factor [Marinilabilia salmonicolor]|uniref:RNA polymerase sigma-70 factor n=1 Tax=Marinilabilia salmonicolor TaxID=989 RepID=UPI00029A20ED|nr:RNA polymerase sigma-70 factor [Marinilabilia salmonicolor]
MFSEKELLKRLSCGDERAFGLLFSSYYERLYYFSLHYLNNNEASKDVVQDLFSVVWEKKEKLENIENLSAWLYSIAKNLCLKKMDHLKVVRKHSDYLKYRELCVNQNSLNELDTSPMIFDEISGIIQATLKSLPSHSRRIFELSRFENKKNKEIAVELDVSLKTVEAHISKCLKIFREALKGYLSLLVFFWLQ